MNLDQASRWRNLAGKAGAFFFLLMFIGILDALIAQFRQPPNVLHVLPGTSVEINGSLEERVRGIQELTYISSSDLIRLSFETTHPGFWFGGQMWRGMLTIRPPIEPGEYSLTVIPKGKTPQKSRLVFRIKVYPDLSSYQQSFKSLIRRYLGISPWWVAVFSFPLTALVFGMVFYFSQKTGYLMAQEGKAEVYRVKKGEAGHEIAFGLGTRHGVQPGHRLILLNESGQPVGTAEVREASETDSVAITGLDCMVRPGYIVSLH